MSGETEQDVSGWTVDTSRADVLRALSEKDLRDAQRFKAHEEVHVHERRELDRAFDAATEKSAAHNDLIRAGERREATYVTRVEYETSNKAMDEKLDLVVIAVAQNTAAAKGARESLVRFYQAIAALGVMAAIVFGVVAVLR